MAALTEDVGVVQTRMMTAAEADSLHRPILALGYDELGSVVSSTLELL